MAASRAITVRISDARLRKLMRARKAVTQSDLINALQLERIEDDVQEDDSEHHQVGRRRVFLRGCHCSASRRSRNRPSRRFPASSLLYRVAASASIPARQTRKVVIWLAVYKSGVHPTVAGVALGRPVSAESVPLARRRSTWQPTR